MLDPFPPPAWFQENVSHPLASYLRLPALSQHTHESAIALVTYQLTHFYLSPFLSRWLFPRHYPNLSPATKLNWHTHVVSSVHSILISTVAVWVMLHDEEWRLMSYEPVGAVERVYGYTGALGLLAALAQGYFIYHLVMATVHFKVFGIGTLFHAVSCSAFIFGFTPFLLFYYAPFLLFEVSNPFVNNYWFLKELGINRGVLYIVNGALLFLSFFVCRVVWGSWHTVFALSDLWSSTEDTWSGSALLDRNHLRCISAERINEALLEACVEQSKFASEAPVRTPTWVAVMYATPLLILCLLNYFWFFKIFRLAWRHIQNHLKTS